MHDKIFTCADFGTSCDVVFRGATAKEVLEQAKKHAMDVHHLTQAELDAPAITEMIAARIREDDGS